MSGLNNTDLKIQINAIVKEYLFNVSSLNNHNYFSSRKAKDSRATFFKNSSFAILFSENQNGYVVEEEQFLEGCTRVFLINPIFKMLMDLHSIQSDRQYGSTFANYTISNREYELSNFIEFIAILDNDRVGIRYTRASYSSNESFAMNRDFRYLYSKENISGFDDLCKVDKVYALDWSGIPNEELDKIHPELPGGKNLTEDISVEQFFNIYFSFEEYQIVVSEAKNAIAKAKEIIALNATPQLLPNNMLDFKQAVINDFNECSMGIMKYKFKDGGILSELSEEDEELIRDTFFQNGFANALIGDADFAKSFITSEYLFKTVKAGLSIDYTAVVVGYLKSVEQLLYLFYVSAFDGASRMNYWDRCNKTNKFDIKDSSRYRYDPYNLDKEWMQEKYFHRKKLGENSPEIGELTRFLRYFEEMWSVSEEGKELIFKCLEDFRYSCRNSYFHKDNIDSTQYDTVERIRNNTHICIYYLLGGFRLLDSTVEKNQQLGLLDYRFENLYREIRQKRRRFLMQNFMTARKL